MTNGPRHFIVYASEADGIDIDLFTTNLCEAKEQCRFLSIQSKRNFEVCELFDGTSTQKLVYGFNYDEDLGKFYEGKRTEYGLDFYPVEIEYEGKPPVYSDFGSEGGIDLDDIDAEIESYERYLDARSEYEADADYRLITEENVSIAAERVWRGNTSQIDIMLGWGGLSSGYMGEDDSDE